MTTAEEQCEHNINAAADAAAKIDAAAGATAAGAAATHDAQLAGQQEPQSIDGAAAADDENAEMDVQAAADGAAAMPSAAPADDLHSAADCEAYLRSLLGGEVALEQAAAVTASLNARHDVLHQEELTYLLQVCRPRWATLPGLPPYCCSMPRIV